MCEAILQRIAELTHAAPQPPRCEFLGCARSVRRLPADPGALRAALAREFTPEELETAGVLIPRQDGQLALSPVLACAGGHCLFQWRGRCEAPFDVVNRHGALVSDDPPAFQASRDFFTSNHLRVLKRRWILVVFSDEDLAVLRMLGVPCTPAAGLAQMTGRQARSLCEDPCDGLRPPSEDVQPAAIASDRCKLILAGCRLAALSRQEPPGLSAVVSRLLKTEDVYELDSAQRVEVWQPDEDDFEPIVSALELTDRVKVRQFILESVRRSIRSPSEYADERSARKSRDYADARRDLLRALRRAKELNYPSPDTARALKAFRRSFHESVVGAMFRDAVATDDPLERSLLHCAAELMERWHQTSVLVRTTQEAVDGHCHPREEALRPEELKERLRGVDSLVKIHRELTRFR